MRVLSVAPEPFHELPYLDAGGRGLVAEKRLPFFRGRVDRLPAGLSAIVAAADLQGLEHPDLARGRGGRLLGEALADTLRQLAALGEVPPPASVGVLLAGDLYTLPGLEKRGGTGDVRPVWEELARGFRWVAGVAGNHDLFGPAAYTPPPGAHLLDGRTVCLDGLRVGGVGGIVGHARRPNRKPLDLYLELLADLVATDVIVLHEGPDHPRARLPGNPALRELLEEAANSGARPLVVCGHSWWPVPLVEVGAGLQVLKVDARVVLLEAA